MEAIFSSETSVHTRSTQRHIPEDGILLSTALRTSDLTWISDMIERKDFVNTRTNLGILLVNT
jgi:hypothetical protein